MKSPCKDCLDRHQSCHSECGRYMEFCELNREINEKKEGLRRIQNYVVESVHKTKKTRKIKRRKKW